MRSQSAASRSANVGTALTIQKASVIANPSIWKLATEFPARRACRAGRSWRRRRGRGRGPPRSATAPPPPSPPPTTPPRCSAPRPQLPFPSPASPRPGRGRVEAAPSLSSAWTLGRYTSITYFSTNCRSSHLFPSVKGTPFSFRLWRIGSRLLTPLTKMGQWESNLDLGRELDDGAEERGYVLGRRGAEPGAGLPRTLHCQLEVRLRRGRQGLKLEAKQPTLVSSMKAETLMACVVAVNRNRGGFCKETPPCFSFI